MKVSVLILTFNEEMNLPSCLQALAWCDDLVVLDSGSTDRTVEIAKAHGARLLLRPFDTFADQRNFGLDTGDFRHEWVLHLDADEVVTPQFVQTLAKLQPPADVAAYHVPSKLMLAGKWLRFAGMYPTYQVRLGNIAALRFKQVGHGQREDVKHGRIDVFNEPYLHHNFSKGLVAWLRKHTEYAEDEAQEIIQIRVGRVELDCNGGAASVADRRRALKRFSAQLPLALRPFARFIYVWIWRFGFLDGRAGLLYALMLAVYEGMIAIIASELCAEMPPVKHKSKTKM